MLKSIKKKPPGTWTLALAVLSLALPLSSAHAGNDPQISITGGALVRMVPKGDAVTLVGISLDFGSGQSSDVTCFKVSTRLAGVDLPTVDVDFKPYTHCDPKKSRFDRWGYAIVSASRELRLRKDLKVTISLIGGEDEMKYGDAENDQFFYGVVTNVLGAQFLRASGFNGSSGADNLLGLQILSAKVYGGVNRKLDENMAYRFTVGLGGDMGVVGSRNRSLTLTGDSSVFTRAAIILNARASQFELFMESTVSQFFIGTTPDQSEAMLDVMMGVEVRQ